MPSTARRRSGRLAAASLLLLCASAPAALAQPDRLERREGYETVSPGRIQSLPASTPDGTRYDIPFVKFSHLFENTLKLYAGTRDGTPGGRARPSQLQNRLLVLDERLQRLLTAGQDSDGKRLIRRQSNIQVFGATKRTRSGVVLVVDRVHRLESYLDYFTRFYESIPEGDVEKRKDLHRQINARIAYFPEDKSALAPLIERLEDEVRQQEYQGLPGLPEGAAEWLNLGYRRRDVDLVSKVWAHTEVSAELRKRAETILRERFEACLFQGVWRSREDLKVQLGLQKGDDGRWIPQERVWLEEAAEREKIKLSKGVSSVQVTQGVLESAMKQGNVLRGMVKNMVLAAATTSSGPSGSFPVHVERYLEKTPKQTIKWELWVMPDGVRVYFCNGLVAETQKPPVDGAGGGEGE